MSEIVPPIEVRDDPDPTDEMIKRLRTAHGRALDASKLSDQEKVAIDNESRLLTKQEKRNFKNFLVKQRFKSNIKQTLKNDEQRLKERKPAFDQLIIDLNKG